MGSSWNQLTLEQRSPSVKGKVDSVMARLDELCSEEDNRDALWGDNQQERWTKLFEYVVRIDP